MGLSSRDDLPGYLDLHAVEGAPKKKCPPEEAIKYNTQFNKEGIDYLFSSGCSPEVADKYPTKLSGWEIAQLFKKRFSYKKVNKYDMRFNGEDLLVLLKSDCSYKIANQYDLRFNGQSIVNAIEINCSHKDAKKYPPRFGGGDIVDLFEVGCPPEEVDKYDLRFDGNQIAELFKLNCSSKKASKYDSRFNGDQVVDLIKSGCSPKKASKYLQRFTEHHTACYLAKIHCPYEKAKKYSTRFSGSDISHLFQANCPPRKAIKYDLRFDGYKIAELFKSNCPPERANSYDSRFSGDAVVILTRIGLTPDKMSPDKKERILNLIFKILDYSPGRSRLLGTGASSVVLLEKSSAWKFSENIHKEYELLKKIQDYHKGNQKNVIKLKNESREDIDLEIEYIKGDSLENILREQGGLPSKKVMKYSHHIMNGLIEMRKAGIWYHRDLRPANIMIDQKNDKAVIIDLGIATTNRQNIPQDNRRYGGFNDLISLGQIMYKMVTGDHLFAKSKSMEKTTLAMLIKDYRDKVYADRTKKLLKKHIKQIDEIVKDEQLRTLIKACLTAKDYHYKKIQRMMASFRY